MTTLNLSAASSARGRGEEHLRFGCIYPKLQRRPARGNGVFTPLLTRRQTILHIRRANRKQGVGDGSVGRQCRYRKLPLSQARLFEMITSGGRERDRGQHVQRAKASRSPTEKRAP